MASAGIDHEFHEADQQARIEWQYVGQHPDEPVGRKGRRPGREPDASGAERLGQGVRSTGRLPLAHLAAPERHRIVRIRRRSDPEAGVADRVRGHAPPEIPPAASVAHRARAAGRTPAVVHRITGVSALASRV